MLLFVISLLDDEQRDLAERIFKEDKAYFFRVANKILASKSDAEDAVAEALLRIVENLEKISTLPRHKMRAYCIIIVKNCAKERIRRDKKIEFTDQPEQYAERLNESAEELFFKSMKDAEIKRVLSVLSEDEQRLLFLRYEERKSYRDIGQTLQCSEDSARMRGFRIIEKMRKQMDETAFLQ